MLLANISRFEDGLWLGGRLRPEVEGLEPARMSLALPVEGSQIRSAADISGVAPCQAAESLTQDGADAKVGQGTGQGAHHAEMSRSTTCSTDQADSTLEELMLNLGSMTGNLLGEDILAG